MLSELETNVESTRVFVWPFEHIVWGIIHVSEGPSYLELE